MTVQHTARIVLPQELPPAPWANRAGYTKEISISTKSGPEHSSDMRSVGYEWRLSLAELTREADFSLLPGIDRVFTLASYGPLKMTVDDLDCTLRLGQQVEFTGEAAVAIELDRAAPQLGLNLMTRRGSSTGSTGVERLDGNVVLDPRTGIVAVTVLEGTAALSDGRKLADLATLVLGAQSEELEAEGCLMAIARVRAV
ncbi:HutD family protein [Arthrobacter sp. ISL-72]|uniref:HutD family protein n=1 Tax=Arthrobacter sp. ISL-72 TaxID=2819114 RepID=UPI001BEB89CC|nr:HutD family protein [Arthrobacter sp. ISL-72]MBT2595939.1 HutD family protein [Arthrobacter sp. ISL-72]